MSQRKLSESLDEKPNYMYKVLNGRRTLELMELIDICQQLGLSPGDVVDAIVAGDEKLP